MNFQDFCNHFAADVTRISGASKISLWLTSGWTGTWNPIFGYLKLAEKCVYGKLNKAFSSCFAKVLFFQIWWFFKVPLHLQCTPLWKIIKFGKKSEKIMNKRLVQLTVNSFLHITADNRNPGFGYPFCN